MVGVAAVLVLGFVHPVAYPAPALRAMAEAIMTVFALAAAVLVSSQFRQTRRLRDLLLLGSLILLALTEFIANALPGALDVSPGVGFVAAGPFGQLIIAGVLVQVARTHWEKIVPRISKPVLGSICAGVTVFALAELTGLLLRHQLLLGSSSREGIHRAIAHPFGLGVVLTTGALFAWAAVEFARRSRGARSPVFPLLAGAAVLLCAARLYFLALPSVASDSLSIHEALRLIAFAFIFTAVVRRQLELRATETRAAAAAERRRVAQDLHDGLAQDLAFIAAQGARMAGELGEEHPVAMAARHALAVSRETISELSDLSSSSPQEVLEAVAHDVGARSGTRVIVDVRPGVVLAPHGLEHVARIAREAIANAARHGHSRHVIVTLKKTDASTVLRIVDDGRGVGTGADAPHEGFGIRSMRERAEALGGWLTVQRAGSKGTEIEVFLP